MGAGAAIVADPGKGCAVQTVKRTPLTSTGFLSEASSHLTKLLTDWLRLLWLVLFVK